MESSVKFVEISDQTIFAEFYFTEKTNLLNAQSLNVKIVLKNLILHILQLFQYIFDPIKGFCWIN